MGSCGSFLVSVGYYFVADGSKAAFMLLTVADPTDPILTYVPLNRLIQWEDPIYGVEKGMIQSCSTDLGTVFMGGPLIPKNNTGATSSFIRAYDIFSGDFVQERKFWSMKLDYFFVSTQFAFMLAVRNNSLWSLPAVAADTSFVAQFPVSGFPKSFPTYAISFLEGNDLQHSVRKESPVMTRDAYQNVVVVGIRDMAFLFVIDSKTGNIGNTLTYNTTDAPSQCQAVTSNNIGQVFWVCAYKPTISPRYARMIKYDRCEPCPAGTYSSNGLSCTKCPPGTWSNTTGSSISICRNCPQGTWSSAEGVNSSSLCIPCGPGRYNNISGAVSKDACKPCPAGTYYENTGNPQELFCHPCLNGKTSAEGAEICKDCPYRTISNPSHTQCITCPEVSTSIIAFDFM
jgi:hypothetical protein